MKPKFAVGDKVVATMGFQGNSAIRGLKGEIVALGELDAFSDHKLYGVRFTKHVDGHSCDKAPRICPKGYGWWVPSSHLRRTR